MNVRIEQLAAKKLIGKHLSMTWQDNRTAELWRSFMLRRIEIKNNRDANLISMQIYKHPIDFTTYHPDIVFEKWAAVEVTDFYTIPDQMEQYIVPEGLYAVFQYKGKGSDGATAFRFIFETWLPGSSYLLDDRPHFEILGANYKNEDSNSEEEIWIPVKPK